MADSARSLLIRILGDSSGLKAATGEAGDSSEGFRGKLSALKLEMQSAEGFSGKLGVAAGGLKDALGNSAVQAGLAAGGITAVAGIAANAVGDFENTALAVDEFATKSGLGAEQASRLYEVVGDLGVNPDQAAAAIGRMNKSVELTPDLFKNAGIEIVRTKDGLLDSNATFLNAIDRLDAIKDPAEQAALGAQLFGKGWQGMAALISEGAPKLKENLAAVQPSKIFTGADIESAKGLRDGFDSIKDAGEGLMLTIGKSLGPVIAELAPQIGKVIEKVAPLAQEIGTTLADAFRVATPIIQAAGTAIGWTTQALIAAKDSAKAWGDIIVAVSTGSNDAFGDPEPAVKLTGAISDLAGANHEYTLGMEDALSAQETLAASHDILTASSQAYANAAIHADDAVQGQAQSTRDAEAAAEALKGMIDVQASATEQATDRIKDHIEVLKGDLDAQKALIDQQRAATDSQFALDSATVNFDDTLSGLNDKLKDAKDNTNKQKVAFDGVKQAAGDVADKTVEVAEKQANLEGKTLSATQKLDLQNQSFVNLAAQAKGPARQAILDYIGSVNGIPPEKMTDIRAALEAGDIDTVNTLLTEASATRTASMKVDADAASIAAANKKIQDGINDIINLHVTGGELVAQAGRKSGSKGATGGIITSRIDNVTLGEAGPEMVIPLDRTGGAHPLPGGVGGMFGGVTVNINVHGDITDGVQDKLDAFARDIAAQLRAGRRQ